MRSFAVIMAFILLGAASAPAAGDNQSLLQGFYGAAWGSSVNSFPGPYEVLERKSDDLFPCPTPNPIGENCFLDRLSGVMIEKPFMGNLARVTVLSPRNPLVISGVRVDKIRYVYYKDRLTMIYLDQSYIAPLLVALRRDLGTPSYHKDDVTAWFSSSATLEQQVTGRQDQPAEEAAVLCDVSKRQVMAVHGKWYFEMTRINVNGD
ncbi:MAG: hypothetical protein LBJ14_01940 [Desulfarculales bacterium]|jgi:hypothetical protein|nr:hypothetical protein [Desulfarculales bacterium]